MVDLGELGFVCLMKSSLVGVGIWPSNKQSCWLRNKHLILRVLVVESWLHFWFWLPPSVYPPKLQMMDRLFGSLPPMWNCGWGETSGFLFTPVVTGVGSLGPVPHRVMLWEPDTLCVYGGLLIIRGILQFWLCIIADASTYSRFLRCKERALLWNVNKLSLGKRIEDLHFRNTLECKHTTQGRDKILWLWKALGLWLLFSHPLTQVPVLLAQNRAQMGACTPNVISWQVCEREIGERIDSIIVSFSFIFFIWWTWRWAKGGSHF